MKKFIKLAVIIAKIAELTHWAAAAVRRAVRQTDQLSQLHQRFIEGSRFVGHDFRKTGSDLFFIDISQSLLRNGGVAFGISVYIHCSEGDGAEEVA